MNTRRVSKRHNKHGRNHEMTMPEIGQPLPDLTFTSGFRETISTADLKGKENLVIAFYAAAFTGG